VETNHFTQLITTCGKKDYEKKKKGNSTNCMEYQQMGDVGEI
jgi:hypothetical protein